MYKFVRVITVSKSYHWLTKSSLFSLLCCLIWHNQYAQTDSLFKAQELCSQKKFEQAIQIIDNVIHHSETKEDPSAWHIRSFAYLQLYTQSGKYNTSKIALLDTSVASAAKSMKLDKTGEYKDQNAQFIENSSKKMFNLCIVLLKDSLNSSKSEYFYNKYKKITSLIKPDFNFKEKDLEYYNGKGSMFVDLYLKNKSRKDYQDVAKLSLLKVLELDPKNISGNINLGVLFYNEGVELMQKMEYDVDLSQLSVVQENAEKLFKQSLPFMNKVYELEPKDARAIEGLEGIYHGLNDYEMETFFRKKKEALNPK
jgi:hypothetical protein